MFTAPKLSDRFVFEDLVHLRAMGQIFDELFPHFELAYAFIGSLQKYHSHYVLRSMSSAGLSTVDTDWDYFAEVVRFSPVKLILLSFHRALWKQGLCVAFT